MASSLVVLHEHEDGRDGIFLDGQGSFKSITVTVEDCRVWALMLDHISMIAELNKEAVTFERT
jgi:hypothetical protein